MLINLFVDLFFCGFCFFCGFFFFISTSVCVVVPGQHANIHIALIDLTLQNENTKIHDFWILWVVDFVGCGFCGLWILWVVDFVSCGFCGLWILWVVDFVSCGFWIFGVFIIPPLNDGAR